MGRIPHPIPYQGSKRRLASAILSHVRTRPARLIEPFAGSAAVTLAAVSRGIARDFVISDLLAPLAEVWQMILTRPQDLADQYEALWMGQEEDLPGAYYRAREAFGRDQDPAKLLYLLARCVKAAVRFNRYGEFNQSPDNRRRGMRPSVMRREIVGAHSLLAGRAVVRACDFREALAEAGPQDLVYLDPPYQGTTNGKDQRYLSGLPAAELIPALEGLIRRGVPFLLSYDGFCGDRAYGEELPTELGLRRVLVNAGRSSQATLAGRSALTVESLYLSAAVLREEPATSSRPVAYQHRLLDVEAVP